MAGATAAAAGGGGTALLATTVLRTGGLAAGWAATGAGAFGGEMSCGGKVRVPPIGCAWTLKPIGWPICWPICWPIICWPIIICCPMCWKIGWAIERAIGWAIAWPTICAGAPTTCWLPTTGWAFGCGTAVIITVPFVIIAAWATGIP